MRADDASEALGVIASARTAASFQPCEVAVTDPGAPYQRVVITAAGPAVAKALIEAGFGLSVRPGGAEVVR